MLRNILFTGSFLFLCLGINANHYSENSLFLLHDIHLSNTTINYNSKSKSYEFTVHVFIDDLTKCLELKGYKNLNIGGKESNLVDEAIEKYLKEKFIITTDKNIAYNYLGRELSEDQIALYIYLESDEYPFPKNFKIKNSLLLELYDDQQNIVKITKDKKPITQILCSKGEDIKTISL